MNDNHDEDLLALYRASRQEQPSELLDRRIRQAARAALKRQRRSWVWGLSTAAVLVLSFSLVLQLWFDETKIESLDDAIQPMAEAPMAPPMPSSAPSPATEMQMEPEQDDVGRMVSGLQQQAPAPRLLKKRAAEGRRAETEEEMAGYELAEDKATSDQALAAKPVGETPLSIPRLPTDEDGLAGLAPELSVEHSASGLLTVYHDNKLILSLKILSLNTGGGPALFKAWPGSGWLGIELDWSLDPAGLADCRDGPVYRACRISARVTGYFEAQRLDHIEWQQPLDRE